jgi:DnaJ-class molecular chaperone
MDSGKTQDCCIDPYEVLGLNRTASNEEIKQSYKRLALKFHPDKTQGDDIPFKRINEAYQILKDPITKQIYDARFQESFNIDVLNSIASSLMTLFHDKLKEKLNHKLGKDGTNGNNKKDNQSTSQSSKTRTKSAPLCIKIAVDICEIYNSCVKKIIVRVMRRHEDGSLKLKSIPFYISLLNYEDTYVFEKMGDDNDENTERGDIIVKIDIVSNKIKGVDIDKLICKYDLQIERQMSLYEYYYGINIKLDYFNEEVVDVTKNVHEEKNIDIPIDILNHSYVHVIEGKGLPYMDTSNNTNASISHDEEGFDKETKRGNLYIIFNLTIPRLDKKDLLLNENFFKAYFNEVSN